MDLNLEQMKDLIELFEDSGLTEISVSQDDYEIILKKESGNSAKPVQEEGTLHRVVQSQEEEADRVEEQEKADTGEKGEESTETEEEEGVFVTSPIVGTFYRSPSPDDSPYVEVGDEVSEGDTVCIVEAMKVMNEVKADAGGKIVEIHADDGDPVEYGQKLLTLAQPKEAN